MRIIFPATLHIIYLEAVGLAWHNHGDGLAQSSRRMQLVEAEHFARRCVHATFRHEA